MSQTIADSASGTRHVRIVPEAIVLAVDDKFFALAEILPWRYPDEMLDSNR